MPLTIHQSNQDKIGKWILTKIDDKVYVSIKSSNEVFNDFFEVYFDNDNKNKLLKMVLKSNKGYIKCSKLLQDFDRLN